LIVFTCKYKNTASVFSPIAHGSKLAVFLQITTGLSVIAFTLKKSRQWSSRHNHHNNASWCIYRLYW